jgi:hypothetical protein
MTVVSVPVVEVEGKKTDRKLNPFFDLFVISHQDEKLISLRFLNTVITLESSRLQVAIKSIAEGQSGAVLAGRQSA